MTEKQDAQEVTFRTLEEACAYLESQGWRCKKSKLSKDVNDKDIPIARTGPGGTFTKRALDAYAKAFCKPLIGAQARDSRVAALVERKLKAETDLAEIKARLASREEQIKTRELIYAAEAFRIMAQLLAQIRADIDNFIYSKVPETVRVVGGQEDKIPDAIELWLKGKAEWMNRFYKAWRDNQPLLVPKAAVEQAIRDLGGAIRDLGDV